MLAKSSFGVVLFAVVLVGTAFSQPDRLKASGTISTWVLSSTKDSVTVSTAYSIPFDRLIFIRTSDTASGFSATLSFTSDAVDSVTGINYHRFVTRKFPAATFDETESKTTKAEGFITYTLPRSVYRTKTELRDDAQKITYVEASSRHDFSRRDSSEVVSVIFLDSLSHGRYYPVMRNNIAAFPRTIRFIVLSSRTKAAQASVSLRTKSGVEITERNSALRIFGRVELNNGPEGIYLSAAADSSREIFAGEIRVDTLNEGRYELSVSLDGRSKVFPFTYLWLNKPFTLRNFKLAFSLLKYIVPDSVYSRLNSGNERERKEKFDSFWKQRDPTPSTAFNELEAVYYKRADYAYHEFATFVNPNGTATARGKAYIMFGKPAGIRREFRNDGTYEIWSYPNLKRTLVFKEERFGEFKLYQTEKL